MFFHTAKMFEKSFSAGPECRLINHMIHLSDHLGVDDRSDQAAIYIVVVNHRAI